MEVVTLNSNAAQTAKELSQILDNVDSIEGFLGNLAAANTRPANNLLTINNNTQIAGGVVSIGSGVNIEKKLFLLDLYKWELHVKKILLMNSNAEDSMEVARNILKELSAGVHDEVISLVR